MLNPWDDRRAGNDQALADRYEALITGQDQPATKGTGKGANVND